MSWRGLWQRVRGSVREEPEGEFRAEMEEHLRLLAGRFRRQGMAEAEAWNAARRQFGNAARLAEERHERRTLPVLETLWADLSYAARSLRKNPAFAAAAVITLGLGIGANTAIFSLCHAVLFQPLPYRDPGRIVMLWERLPDGRQSSVAPANFVDWRAQSRSFREMAAVSGSSFILTGSDQAARLSGAAVSANFFSVLGVQPALGRGFLLEEDQPGRNRVVILSHRIWRERFGADPQIAGKQVTLNDAVYTIAGVLPADFQFGTSAQDFQPRNQYDLWVPLALDLQKLQRGTHPLRVVARLAPGVAQAQAQAQLNVLGASLAEQYPFDNRKKGIVAVPIAEQVTGSVRVALEMLLAAVGLVLLLACANVANLLLSRAAARQREIAVRVALGAGRLRLAQQMLTESLFLAGLGGVAGLLLAMGAIAALSSHLPADLSRAAGTGIQTRVLLFTAAVSLLTGLLFGLGPLYAGGRVTAGETLRQTSRVAGGSHQALRSALAVAQIAIAIILLVGAGLLGKSFLALLRVSPGFRTESILTARLSLPRSRYPENRRIAAFEGDLLDSLRRSPAIQAAGLTTYLPLSGSDNGWAFFIEGQAPLPVGVFNFAKYRPVSAGYFEAIGMPLLRGRSFTPADTPDAPWTVVINASMAREFWGFADPVGQRLHFGSDTWRTVIGVVGDVLHEGLDGESKPEMYVPMSQAPNVETGPTLVVRTAMEAGSVASEVRRAVASLDRAIPVDRIETMEQLVSTSVSQPRFRTLIVGAFSLLALAMASIGIYGVMNYLVIQRTREFGIRLSVGATAGDVLRLVLRRALVLIGAGTAIGLGGAILLVRLIAKLLFGTAPLDPLVFTAVPVLLAAVALAACYLPARRATRVDPMTALRYE